MGCSSQKNIEVENDKNLNKENKNINKEIQKNVKNKENGNEESKIDVKEEYENSEKENSEEEIGMNDKNQDNIENYKKKHMSHEYYFYPTKNIPKRKFVKRDIDKELPSDFANIETNDKNRQYFCFVKNNDKDKNKKINKIAPPEERETEKNNLLDDEIYLFNRNMKKIKSIKPLKREEILKPYNYQIELEMNEDGIIDKKSNKENNKYDYLDMFPNGEGYKFINNDEEIKPKEQEKKIDIPINKKIEDKKMN